MDVKALNDKLADFPYVGGYKPSQADVEQLNKLPHLTRWVQHMASFSEAEKKAFPKASGAAPSSGKKAAAPAAPKVAEPAKKGGDDDDDMDLFGSDDDEEAEKAKAERAKQMEAQKKAGGKPGVIAKSSIVLDVKVWDDETDLNQIEQEVRAIQKDGLLWGAAKKVPVAFGMHKLQIVCVVEDEKVSVDWLTDQIEELELVQSTDIAAFQKI